MTSDHDNENANGWREWSQYVLKTLERIESRIDTTDNRIRRVETQQVIERTKMMVYAGCGGAIIAVAVEIVKMVWK